MANLMVTFYNTDAITVSLPVNVKWTLITSGEIGTASFFVPKNSPAYDPAYIHKLGGSRVEIGSRNGSGTWKGIITSPKYTPAGIDITAHHEIVLLTVSPVGLNERLLFYGTHEIVANVLSNAPFGIGSITPTLPFRNEYLLHGEPIWDILGDLLTETKCDFWIDEDSLCHWGTKGTTHDEIILSGSQLIEDSLSTDVLQQRGTITAMRDNDYRQATLLSEISGFWPAHDVIKTDGNVADELQNVADSELSQRSIVPEYINGSLVSDYWHVQDGDYIRANIPYAEFGGVTRTCRVIKRSISSGDDRMIVELEILPFVDTSETSIVVPKTDQYPPRRGKNWYRNQGRVLKSQVQNEKFGRVYLTGARNKLK